MVAVAIDANVQQYVLQLVNLGHTCHPEEIGRNGVTCHATLAQVDLDATRIGHQAAEGDVHGADAPLVAAITHALAQRRQQNFVVGNTPLALHHRGGHGSAVEEDALVVLVLIVVVPIQQANRLVGGEVQRLHGDGVADVHLAGGGHALVVEHTHGHTGRDAHLRLNFRPAADGERIEVGLGAQVVECDAQPHDVLEGVRRHALPRGVVAQRLGLDAEGGSRRRDGLHALEDVRHVEGLHGDAVALQGDLVDAHRFEGGCACANRAHHHALDALDNLAGAVKLVDVLAEGLATRAHRVGLEHREFDAHLAEDIHNRNLAAEGVAPLRRAHLVEVVRVGLNPDGDVGVLERSHSAVLVAEVGQADDNAAKLAAVGAQEVGVDRTLHRRLHCPVARGVGVEHEHIMAEQVEFPLHLLACAGYHRRGKEAAVSEKERECGLLHGVHIAF